MIGSILRGVLIYSACLVAYGGDETTFDLRVVRVDPLDMWQLTDEPAVQGIVVDVVEDPGDTLSEEQVYLLLKFGPISKSQLLRREPGGLVLDTTVLKPGRLLTIRRPIGASVPCPVATAEGGRSLAPKTPEGLSCYAVEIESVFLKTTDRLEPDGESVAKGG